MDALSGRRAPPPPGVNELRQRESAVFRWLRAESTLGWGWVRRPVPSRNEARNAQSRERQGPKVKTAAQRRLSLRPDCARAGLRRARAHERNLAPRGSSTRQHGAFARPCSRERGVPLPASEAQLLE